jgi:hypothetical protein
MLFREMIPVYRENNTKHTNTLCGQNVKLLDVTTGGTHSYHCAVNFKGLIRKC